MTLIEFLEKKIEEIKNSDFEVVEVGYSNQSHKAVKLLNKALYCYNYIGSYIQGISKEERTKLLVELDEVMKNKIRELNPNFSEQTLDNMVSSYHRSNFTFPIDILIVDDAVFHKNVVVNDYGEISKIKTFRFDDEKPYYDLDGSKFVSSKYSFLDDKDEELTKEDNIYTSRFISDNINSIYGMNITRPIFEFNSDKCFYGYGKIICSQVNVYINETFENIGESIKNNKELDLKICFQDGENIMVCYVHQTFKDGKPIWVKLATNDEVWRFTNEVLKLQNQKGAYQIKKDGLF